MKGKIVSARDSVLQQALALDPVDRAFVAEELERSLSQTPFESEEIAGAWLAEFDRRIDALERGETKAVEIDSALDHARQALVEHRARRTNS